MIYLDNNATINMPDDIVRALIKWSNRGNASSSYPAAAQSRAMMNEFRQYIASLCKFAVCCEEPRDSKRVNSIVSRSKDTTNYKVIFTSCASESNAFVIAGAVEAALLADPDVIPHVVTSAIEHKSILEHLHNLEEQNKVIVTYVSPEVTGHILPAKVAAAITAQTCLITIMHANNETGAINDIWSIGKIAKKAGIPFHVDCVQTFGKAPANVAGSSNGYIIDSLAASAHKFGGPVGCGLLIIRQGFLYGLSPLIYGSQNEGWRGGTENVAAIGASYAALKFAMNGRDGKNRRLEAMKRMIIDGISKAIPTLTYEDYYNRAPSQPHHALEIVLFECDSGNYLPNTILLSIVKHTKPPICNIAIKKSLENEGIIVSIASACLTASPRASHVMYALGADQLVRKGVLRISLGDANTENDCRQFVKIFTDMLRQMQKMK